MSRRADRNDEPVLFDLPLDPPPRRRAEPVQEAPPEPIRGAAPDAARSDEPSVLSLFDADTLDADSFDDAPEQPIASRASTDGMEWDESEEAPRVGPRAVPDRRDRSGRAGRSESGPPRVTLGTRYFAGLTDLAVHVGVAVLLLFGARLLGVAAGYSDWPALVVFLLAFSFLYTIPPLAFWGQTPGMAWAGLVARAPGDISLTFGQTVRRWVASIVTVALIGLPTLLALFGGRSLADRVSGSDLHAV